MKSYHILSLLLLPALVMLPSRADLHVSPQGADSNAGTETSPFLTLERARDEIRSLKQQGDLPPGGVKVLIHPGEYAVRQSF